MDPLILVTALAIVVAGAVLFYAMRLTGQLRAAETRGAAAEEQAKQAELLRMTLTGVTGERDEALRKIVELQADARNFDARMQEMLAAKETLTAQFHEIGAKLLGEAQRQFLERADARFTQAGETNEAKLKALLQPVEATLKRYEDNLSLVEKERVGSYSALQKAVELLHAGHTQVKEETARLVNALRSSPKARGRWGEQSLKNVLLQAGLAEGIDFEMEVSVGTDEGRLRPDVIVNLPGGRKLIIDAKCSLNAYLDASEQVDEEARKSHLKAHAGSIRNHAQQLGSKAYWAQFDEAADYVVMYIPGEHFLTAALEQDDGLWDWAFERKVLLATPTNLVAIARTVASVWRQEKLAEQAAEIAALGKELHSRLATMGGHVARLGRNLELANGAYNSFVGSLESQVMSQAKRFEALEVSGAKEVEPLPVIESSPRPLTKLVSTASEEAA
ncbi:DNA recombination protein RmuC [Sphingomonas sp.]|uniref:DNA recombination protein RmuC n=1 Tax=Sphingomonas sp. TaxID=28214 RepID=UPI002DB6A463|nr:DNA recombination protein RmuC [Sphingomonas sp.]HEU4967786.1 DNA recombination protein RmuC [Sphingomonas sp.]